MSGAMYVYDNGGKPYKFNSMGDYQTEIPIIAPWGVTQGPTGETVVPFVVVGLTANASSGGPILYVTTPGNNNTLKKIIWLKEKTGTFVYSYTLPPGFSFPVEYLCTDSIYVYTKPLTGDLTGILKIDKSAGLVSKLREQTPRL